MPYLKRSSGGGNATVPLDAPIQPPQAFVDNIEQFLGLNPVDCSNQQITHWSAGGLSSWSDAIYSGLGLNLSGNLLSTTEVDAILAWWASSGYTNATLDLSGPYMGVPTPVQTPTNGQFTIEIGDYITDLAIDTVVVDIALGDIIGHLQVITNSSFLLSDSYFTPAPDSPTFTIGVLDTPTSTQIAVKIASLTVGTSLSVVSQIGTSVVFVVNALSQISDKYVVPLVDFAPTPNYATIVAAGVAFEKNADITTINANGGTVTCMEYVNRVDNTDGTESITYSS